jgi:hypothetical protein
LVGGNSLPICISFDPSTLTFSVVSTTDSDAGIYNIQVTGSLAFVSAEIFFTLTVEPTCYATVISSSLTTIAPQGY